MTTKEFTPINFNYNEYSKDAIGGQSSAYAYNPLLEYNGITGVCAYRKGKITRFGIEKDSFSKLLTIFYINVQ